MMTIAEVNTTRFLDATLFAVFLFLTARYIQHRWLRTQKLPYPPGPHALPLIGNLLGLPKQFAWIQWAKHKELYGPISHVEVLGKHLILLNEVNVAVDLMEKRSNVYSDRPRLVFCGEMIGWKDSLPLTNLDVKCRRLRKNLHQVIGTKSYISKFHPLLTVEARKFVIRLKMIASGGGDEDFGERLLGHIRITAGAIILSMSHGYAIEVDPTGEKLDPLVELAENGMRVFSTAATSGKWLVDLLPLLRHIPSWPYEPAFKKTAREWRKITKEVLEIPHAFVKHKMSTGDFTPSITSTLLKHGPTSEEEEIIKWSANALYAAGSDTTVVTIYVFFLAMTLFPDVQRKAQDELDALVGTDRLPTIEDRASLPYVDAVVMEVMRWIPIIPMGFPHVASADGVYRGYYIPRGAILMANTWLYTRDLANYHDPEEFKPERFLGSNPEKDPRCIIFGYGRRICPGRELADTVVFISIATILATYDISKASDARGEPIEPEIEFGDGVLSELKVFPCKATPRRGSEKLFKLIELEEEAAEGQSPKTQSSKDWEVLQKLKETQSWAT